MSEQELITLPDGSQVGTGLLVPDQRLTRFPLFEDSVRELTDDQIRSIIHDPDRDTSRQRFPQSEWARRQTRNDCNGYAAARALGKARVLRGLDPVHLSGEFVYAHINGGRDEGSMLDDAFQLIQDVGIAPESTVQIGTYQLNKISREAKSSAAQFKGFECYGVSTRQALMTGVALGFVGVVAVHVPRGNSFTRTDSKGRVPRTHGVGNHAVMIDDIVEIDGRFHLDMDYDWGRTVGDDGKGYISFEDHLEQTIRHHFFYLIRSTSDGPA